VCSGSEEIQLAEGALTTGRTAREEPLRISNAPEASGCWTLEMQYLVPDLQVASQTLDISFIS